jgi:hypothetical protein
MPAEVGRLALKPPKNKDKYDLFPIKDFWGSKGIFAKIPLGENKKTRVPQTEHPGKRKE